MCCLFLFFVYTLKLSHSPWVISSTSWSWISPTSKSVFPSSTWVSDLYILLPTWHFYLAFTQTLHFHMFKDLFQHLLSKELLLGSQISVKATTTYLVTKKVGASPASFFLTTKSWDCCFMPPVIDSSNRSAYLECPWPSPTFCPIEHIFPF